MTKLIWSCILLIAAVGQCRAQEPAITDWPHMMDSKQCKTARKLCNQFVDSKDLSQRVEAQKCLANVALCEHETIILQGDDAGGGTIGSGYTPAAVDEALTHLNKGIELAPQDLSLHEGRLHILEVAGRYDDMVEALDESCNVYKGSDALQAWVAYSSELADLRQYRAGLEFLRILDKHYPHSPDVLSNIGAFLSIQNKASEAIPYLVEAVQLAPQDPINTWDLGKAYDLSGQIQLADQWYQKGLSLQTDHNQLFESSCLYAEFVEKKLHDDHRACALQMKSCDKHRQTACAETKN